MKVVYIADKLRDPSHWEVAKNVHQAAYWALEVAKLGAMPLCPHTNTGARFLGELDEKFWLAGDIELMVRCDGVLFIPGWEESEGARAEYHWEGLAGLEKFETSPEELLRLGRWIRGENHA